MSFINYTIKSVIFNVSMKLSKQFMCKNIGSTLPRIFVINFNFVFNIMPVFSV